MLIQQAEAIEFLIHYGWRGTRYRRPASISKPIRF